MTVITQAICEKKLQKQPLVTPSDIENGCADYPDCQPLSNGTPMQNQPNHPRRTALLVHVNRTRAKNLQNLTITCILLGAVLVFCSGLLASFYWYQHHTLYKRHYKGWCGIPYMEKMSPEEFGKAIEMQSLYGQMSPAVDARKTFYEEFDIDLEFGEYEKIDIPDFSKGRKGQFIHDFTLNKTAIVDFDEHRCFIMDLDRTQVLPPKDLYEKILKFEKEPRDLDFNTEMIREQYSVVLPALDHLDRSSLGFYIYESCFLYPIYKLEKIAPRHDSIAKRSTPSSERENTFFEYAGKQISKIEIINLSNAPGRQ